VALQWADDKDIPTLMGEMERCSTAKILPPDINLSGVQFHTNYDRDEIYWSLNRIRMVGVKTAECIVRERERGGSFGSVTDFIERIFRHRLTKGKSGDAERTSVDTRHLKNLILAGCFDRVEGIENVTERSLVLKRAANLLRFEINAEEFPTEMLDRHYFWSRLQVALSGIGSIDYRRIFDNSPARDKIKGRASWMSLRDALDTKNEGKKVAICATVTHIEELSYNDRQTGDRVAFAKLTIQQNTDTMELICWNDFYAPRRREIAASKDRPIVITATIKYSDYSGTNTLNTMKSSLFSVE
jgi:DNA polymerase-3 subunit alpha